MAVQGSLRIDGTGFRDYSALVKNFQPEPFESLKERFPEAIEELITEENSQTCLSDRKHIFDCEDGWRLFIHRSITEDYSGQVISVLAYHADFQALPMPLQSCKVLANFTAIAGEDYFHGEFIRSWPGHVAFMFPLKEVA